MATLAPPRLKIHKRSSMDILRTFTRSVSDSYTTKVSREQSLLPDLFSSNLVYRSMHRITQLTRAENASPISIFPRPAVTIGCRTSINTHIYIYNLSISFNS